MPLPRNEPGKPPPKAPQPPTPRFRVNRGWLLFFVALLIVNFYVSSRATQPTSRVRVPYSPFFLHEVQVGDVKQITSKGTAIQGTFKKPLSYNKSKPTTRFQTEIPAFADNNALSALLQKKGVIVNATPLASG